MTPRNSPTRWRGFARRTWQKRFAISPEGAAKVMEALPFDLAVQVFDEPELAYYRAEIVRHMS